MIVAVAIVAAIYLWGVFRRKRDTAVTFDRPFARVEIPEAILDHGRAEPVAQLAQPQIAEPQAQDPLLAEVVLPPEDEVLSDLPPVRNEAAASGKPPPRRDIDQLDLFAGPAISDVGAGTDSHSDTESAAPTARDDVISLYVRSRSGVKLGGNDLVKALNGVGMRYGDMAIFHHHGAGELVCNEPIFSAANMFEPGTFDLRKIDGFQTSGITLFMQLPGALDGAVAFELLLNTAQRFAELTDCELYATPQARLDGKAIAGMRKRAAQFISSVR